MPHLNTFLERWQFALGRVLVGLCLLFLFLNFFLKRKELTLLAEAFPYQSNTVLPIAPLLGIIFAVLLICGFWTSLSACANLICLQVLIFYFPILREIQLTYYTAILVLFALFCAEPTGFHPLTATLNRTSLWRFPLMICVYLGLTVSGLSKLFYSGWLNGGALDWLCLNSKMRLMTNQCGYFFFRPAEIFVLWAEASAFPLILIKKMRPLAWLQFSILSLGLLLLMPFTEVSIGILVLQIFLFDSSWIPKFKLPKRASPEQSECDRAMNKYAP